MDKLKILLYLGAAYYLIGSVVHLFGMTLFPFYDGAIYSPYHDTVISLVAIILSILLFTIAKDPKKNIDALNVVIIGCVIAIVYSIGIIFFLDFDLLGAPAKKTQTMFELILLVMFALMLHYLKPKK